MPEFLTLLPPDQALDTILSRVSTLGETEEIHTDQALNRITGEAILAPYALPSFPRSTVDGYAVISADTHGASDSIPMYLICKGEVPMGGAPDFHLQKTECALIHTGGMLPDGADAVVMVENTQEARHQEIEVLRAVSVGENVLQIGEDVTMGQQVISSGKRLRPAEIGGLMALGITEVRVARKPKVGIISSGDEVVPPDQEIQPGQIRDINSYTLEALIANAGGEAKRYGIVADTFEAMRATARKALAENDLVVITAGSSASTRDLTSQVVDSLGDPGVLVHGVNVRPGKPSILGLCGGKPVIGLPGNPVSALVIAGLFVVPVVERMLGMDVDIHQGSVTAKLTVNLSSKAGREDWVPVQLKDHGAVVFAEPIFGKSNLIFTLVKADGLIKIPADANGLAAGEQIKVWLV